MTTTWLDIRDAWRGTRHVVQVRAQEEFGHGAWSEWSQEAAGTPWTGRRGKSGPKARGSAPASSGSRPPLPLQIPGRSPLKWDPSAHRWGTASVPEGTQCAPGWIPCPCVGQGDTRAGGLPHPLVLPCPLLQFPVEDGAHRVTLPPELFGEDPAGGTGGEEGTWISWGELGAPRPPSPQCACPSSPLQGLWWKPAPALWHLPTPSWWPGGACSWASPSSLALW